MPETDAVMMDNIIPRPGYSEVRRGYVSQTTGFASSVQTVFVWRGGGAGVDKIFAAAGAGIYDCNTIGAVGGAVVSGLGSAIWQYINFANDAGNFLLAFNGSDTPRKYDGTSWATNSITGSSGSITLTSTDLIDACVNKRRVFMTEKDSLRVWYLDVDAISGACGLLDLGPVFNQGGTIAGIAAWTQDGGMGSDDLLVIVTTEGQVAVYQGTDPSDPDNWALIGVYTLGAPLGRRSLLQYGADLVILTANGVLPLSQAAQFDRAQDGNVALTAKIQNAFAQASRLYGANFGWEAFLYPAGQIAIYNVPISQLGVSYQFVQNVQTGSWCRFKGINAFCWGYANGNPYFGASDGVYRWDSGGRDGTSAITCDYQGAFVDFGGQHQLKKFTMIRPVLKAPRTVAPGVDILTDYRSGIPENVPTVSDNGGGMIWGDMIWGSMVWGASNRLRLDWASTTGIGYVGSARMRIVLAPPLAAGVYPEVTCQIIGFDAMYERGSMI